ncbi:MAG: hypothetical protein HY815_03600 [Candidatus Riflebacteria bacterium]|nr:hypothetical protein [Candidatus Riflebacteria bacterium]
MTRLRLLQSSVLAAGLWALLGAESPCRGADLPPNMTAANLGESTASLSIRPLELPYYVGERLVLEVMVRNTATIAQGLPGIDMLDVTFAEAPTPEPRMGPSLEVQSPDDLIRKHQCGDGAYLQRDDGANVYPPHFGHLAAIAKGSVKMAPGESRSGIWVSRPLNRRNYGALGVGPMDFGVRVSCHDILPDRWLRFRVQHFTEVSGTQLLTPPLAEEPTLFFTAPAGADRYLLLAVGSWWRVGGGSAKPRADTLNALARNWTFSRFGVLDKSSPALTFDPEGTLLADGRPMIPRWYVCTSGGQEGWVIATRSSPETGPYRLNK